MKINAVLFTGKKIKHNYPADKDLLVITTMLISAIIISVFVYVLSDIYINENIESFFKSYIENAVCKNKTELFINMLIPIAMFHLLLIIFSTSYFGDILIGILSFLKISGLSLLIAYIYSAYGLTGIEYVFLVIAPGKLIYVLSLILCMKNSLSVISNIRQKEKITDASAVAVRFIVSLLLTVASVAIDMIMFTTFSGLFSF